MNKFVKIGGLLAAPFLLVFIGSHVTPEMSDWAKHVNLYGTAWTFAFWHPPASKDAKSCLLGKSLQDFRDEIPLLALAPYSDGKWRDLPSYQWHFSKDLKPLLDTDGALMDVSLCGEEANLQRVVFAASFQDTVEERVTCVGLASKLVTVATGTDVSEVSRWIMNEMGDGNASFKKVYGEDLVTVAFLAATDGVVMSLEIQHQD